jgi:hypothetical protein
MANDNRKKNNPEYERNQFINFFEELCWLLDSNKDINFKNASKYLKDYRNILMHGILNNDRTTDEYNLIGILPYLLKDGEIFQNNSQLVQFADEVLALSIPRWEKKSRNEIIGLIVCEVEDANKQRLNTLISWTRNILNNKNEVKNMQNNAKNTGNMFSWNETIQKLVGTENE